MEANAVVGPRAARPARLTRRRVRARLRTAALVLTALVAAGGALPVAAQSLAQEQPRSPWPEGEWTFGGSMGLPGLGREPLPAAFTVGAHAQYLPTGPVGVEGSLGIAPLGFAFGGLVVGARAGLVAPLRTRSVVVLPSAGASMIAGASREGVESGRGMVYAGLATLSAEGLRLGVTLHWVDAAESPVWLVEFGGIRLPDRPQ